MSTPKITLTVEVMTLRARVAELEGLINAAREAELKAQHVHHIAPIITRFTKHDGTTWEKTRVGNRAVSRQVLSN